MLDKIDNEGTRASLKSLRLRKLLTFGYLTYPYLSLPFLTFSYLFLPYRALLALFCICLTNKLTNRLTNVHYDLLGLLSQPKNR